MPENTLETLEKENRSLKSELRQWKLARPIVQELGLPDDFAARLKGETEAEIRADAAFVAQQMGIKPKDDPDQPTSPAFPETVVTDEQRQRDTARVGRSF